MLVEVIGYKRTKNVKKKPRFRTKWEYYQIPKESVMFNSKAVFLSDMKASPNVHLLKPIT